MTRAPQRGLGTLAIVIGLFLVMGLISAFAARTLMLEQRIAGHHQRGAMADEMAEAGLEWAVAMLNAGPVDDQCQPSPSGRRFVDRYLNVSPTHRNTQPRNTTGQLAVDCVRTSAGLACRCPAANTRTAQPSAPEADYAPSFGLVLGVESPNPHLGSFLVDSWGCSESSVDDCRTSAAKRSETALAVSRQRAAIGFLAAVPTPPQAALTVLGQLSTAPGWAPALTNIDPAGSGLLALSGRPAPTLDESRLHSLPTLSPAQARRFNDPAVQALAGDAFFHRHLGWAPGRYREHPALQRVACGAGDCSGALQAAANAGARMLWVDGPVQLFAPLSLGAAADPVLLVIDGDATLAGAFQLSGLLFVRGQLAWTHTTAGAVQVQGMVAAQGDMRVAGALAIEYSLGVADQLRNRLGSYVRVPGGWQDLEAQ